MMEASVTASCGERPTSLSRFVRLSAKTSLKRPTMRLITAPSSSPEQIAENLGVARPPGQQEAARLQLAVGPHQPGGPLEAAAVGDETALVEQPGDVAERCAAGDFKHDVAAADV